jgi:hypothetical protein
MVGEGRRLQPPRCAGRVPFDILFGQMSLPPVFRPHAAARKQLHQPGNERLQQRRQLVVSGSGRLDDWLSPCIASESPNAPLAANRPANTWPSCVPR